MLRVAPNLHIVMRRLGHSSITTTVDEYGHLLPDLDLALADGLEKLFSGEERRDDGPGESVAEALRRGRDYDRRGYGS